MARPIILYHGGACADGFCSAWLAWRRFKDDADYVPVNYGEPPPDVKGRDVFILDFSYPLPAMYNLYAACQSLVVLDHHRTAAEALSIFGGDKATVVFDINKSGARLTWEHFNKEYPVPWLVDWTEDRDTWAWKLPRSRAISAYIASHPWTFMSWEGMNAIQPGDEAWNMIAREGEAILRYMQQQAEGLASKAVLTDVCGYQVPCVNATGLISEVGEILSKGQPFSATWFERTSDGRRVYSLRSAKDEPQALDVSVIAKTLGGGGHKNAAGFVV